MRYRWFAVIALLVALLEFVWLRTAAWVTSDWQNNASAIAAVFGIACFLVLSAVAHVFSPKRKRTRALMAGLLLPVLVVIPIVNSSVFVVPASNRLTPAKPHSMCTLWGDNATSVFIDGWGASADQSCNSVRYAHVDGMGDGFAKLDTPPHQRHSTQQCRFLDPTHQLSADVWGVSDGGANLPICDYFNNLGWQAQPIA
jgi:hypothetical protein